MKKTQTASFTDKFIKSPKFWMTVNFSSTIALGIALLVSLIVGGYRAQFIIFPIAMIVTDILFLLVSLFSNFRFKYTAPIPVFYLLVSVALTVLTIATDGGANGTRLFTHAAIYVFIALHVIAATAWWLSYTHASSPAIKKMKTRIAAALLGIVLVLSCGIYGFAVFHYGWFGQGAFGVERALEYSWNEKTQSYDVVGLASERGDTVVVPDSFNGAPIGTVDCSFASDKTIKNIYFNAENITADTFISPESLYSENSDRTIYGKVYDGDMPLQAALLELARTKRELVYFDIAGTTAPTGLADDQIFVSFAYDFDDLHLTDGNFFFLWVGNRGESVPTSILSDVPYLKYLYDPADPNNESHLVWAYDNANRHIFTGVDTTDFPGFDKPIHQSYTGVKFNFEPLIKINVAEDNDTVYKMNGDFSHFDAENGISHVFTANEIDTWFAKADKRNGFDLSWTVQKNATLVKTAIDANSPLSLQVDDGSTLYPTWTMKAPVITSALVTKDVVYGETASFTSAASSASADLFLSYEWKFNGTLASDAKNFNITNVLKSHAGIYSLTVTSSNPAITSLTATDTEAVQLTVAKRGLKLDWTFPTDPVYTSYSKRVSWDINTKVSTAMGIINGDTVALTEYYQDITDADTYTFAPMLDALSSDLYYIQDEPINTFTITPAPLTITWGTNVLVYNAQNQLPTAYAPGLGEDGSIPITLTGAVKNVGTGTASATIQNTNYALTNAKYAFSVTPFTIDVSWTDTEAVYNSKAFRPTATANGFEPDGTVKFTVSGEAINVGVYTATVDLDVTGNYKASNTTKESEYSITKRPITVNWTIPSVVEYSGSAWNYTVEPLNVANNESVSFVYAYTNTASAETAPTDAGSYGVSVSFDEDNLINKNYMFDTATETSLDITVEKVELHLSWIGDGQVYDTAKKQVRITSLGISSEILISEAESIIECTGTENTFAGDYVATAALTSDKNFVISSGASYSYTIAKRTVLPIWNKAEAQTFVYDGTAKTVYVTLEGIHSSHITSDVIKYTNQTKTDAGNNYVASIELINDNYKLASGSETSFTYSIEKRTLQVGWALETTRDLVYDGSSWVWLASLSGEVAGEAPTISFTYQNRTTGYVISAPVGVGSYQLVASLGSGDVNKNYKLSGAVHDFTVTPKPVDVSWGSAVFTFNGTAQKPSATYTDIYGYTVNLTVNGAMTNASSSAYTATAVCSDSNYKLVNPTEDFIINPLTVTAVWGSTDFTYNANPQKPTATFTDVNGTPRALTVSGEQINASTSPYIATASSADTNYAIAGATTEFTIAPKTVSVVWGTSSFVYNGKAQKPTATFTNVKGATVNLTVTGEQTNASASLYTATASTDDTNYTITGVETTFSIHPCVVNVAWSNLTLIFNGKAQKPTATFTDVNNVKVPLTVTGEQINASDSLYTATISHEDTNYTLTGTSCNFTISKKIVAVQWKDTELVYNGKAQKPTATFIDVNGTTVTLTVTGEQTNASSTGYTAQTSYGDENYLLTGTAKSFKISPKPVEVEWSNTEFTYNGATQKPTATFTDVNGNKVTLTVKGEQTNARSTPYTATASVSNTNYTLNNHQTTFTITPMTVNAIWGSTDFIYNGASQKPTATFINIKGNAVTLTVIGEQTNASDNPYTATATTTDGNYTVSEATRTQSFRIKPLTVSAIWTNTTLTYNGTAQAPTATFTNALGASVSLTVQGAQANVGEYTATATLADTNYTLTNNTVSFWINPLEVKIEWTNTELTYTGSALKPTATVKNNATGQVVSATATVTVTAGNGIDVGTHTATAALNSNFTVIGGSTCSYRITPATVTVSWNTVNGILVPTVNGAPAGAYQVTYYVNKGTNQSPSYSEYTSSKFNAGSYKVTVTLTGNSYVFSDSTKSATNQFTVNK